MKKEKKFAEAKSHVWRTPMGTNRYWSLRGAFQHQKELIYGLSGLKYDPVSSLTLATSMFQNSVFLDEKIELSPRSKIPRASDL
jgi:hypothetical protein